MKWVSTGLLEVSHMRFSGEAWGIAGRDDPHRMDIWPVRDVEALTVNGQRLYFMGEQLYQPDCSSQADVALANGLLQCISARRASRKSRKTATRFELRNSSG
jgi:hypothetical protein